jgi:amino acid transporter
MANDKMNFNATWSMTVVGMVVGGIFSDLGVIIQSAGQWAWLSFVIAGLIALISASFFIFRTYIWKKIK